MASPSRCALYHAWEGRLSPRMRQVHPPGERMFVEYAGQTVELIDGRSGEIRQAQIFLAVMGASSYPYAEASWTQTSARLYRRRTGAAGPRQPEGRSRPRQRIRAGFQPHLSRPGDPLPHRDPSGTAAKNGVQAGVDERRQARADCGAGLHEPDAAVAIFVADDLTH